MCCLMMYTGVFGILQSAGVDAEFAKDWEGDKLEGK